MFFLLIYFLSKLPSMPAGLLAWLGEECEDSKKRKPVTITKNNTTRTKYLALVEDSQEIIVQ